MITRKSLEFLGYVNHEIGTDGRVWSRINSKRKVLPSWKELKGFTKVGSRKYKRVELNSKTWSVHRLVALAFIPNPLGYPCVLHNNDKCKENNVENLRWGTQEQNVQDIKKHNPSWQRGSKSASAKLKEEHIPEIRKLYKDGITKAEIARRFKVSFGAINSIILNRTWTHI